LKVGRGHNGSGAKVWVKGIEEIMRGMVEMGTSISSSSEDTSSRWASFFHLACFLRLTHHLRAFTVSVSRTDCWTRSNSWDEASPEVDAIGSGEAGTGSSGSE